MATPHQPSAGGVPAPAHTHARVGRRGHHLPSQGSLAAQVPAPTQGQSGIFQPEPVFVLKSQIS